MDLELRTTEQIQASIDALQHSLESMVGPITAASQLLVTALLNGGKVLSCGTGTMNSNAQRLSGYLSHHFEMERPGLPAITLGQEPASTPSSAMTNNHDELFSHGVKVLGQQNDILVIFSAEGMEQSLIQAVNAAHQREISVIAITGHQGGELANLLTVGDIEIRVQSSDNTRIQEVQVLVTHCLCDLIDHQLFGAG